MMRSVYHFRLECREEMAPELLATFSQRWREDVGKQLGFDTYQDFREANLKEFGRSHLM